VVFNSIKLVCCIPSPLIQHCPYNSQARFTSPRAETSHSLIASLSVVDNPSAFPASAYASKQLPGTYCGIYAAVTVCTLQVLPLGNLAQTCCVCLVAGVFVNLQSICLFQSQFKSKINHAFLTCVSRQLCCHHRRPIATEAPPLPRVVV
jgi:hypothetical protein